MKFDKSILNSVAGASIILTLLGFISKGIGFIREMVYAERFGLSKEFDLFLVCIAFPNLINTATIYVTQHYFIPSFNKIKEESIEESVRFFNFAFWLFLLGALVISVILYGFSEFILNLYLSNISVEMKNLSIKTFHLLLLTIPMNAGMSIIMSYQQAKFKFLISAFSLIILNILVIIIILLFNNLFQIFVLPVSFVIGYFVSFIFLIFNVREKLNFNFSLFRINTNYRTESKTILILIIIEVLSLSYVMLDRYFISEIDPGGIAALNYSFVIYSLPISLFSLPLVTTMFSKFSNSNQTIAHDLRTAYRINFFAMIPFVFILYFWGNFFIHIFYERGKFSAADTILTFNALKIYSLSLVFLTTYFLVVKVLYSQKKYNAVFAISVIVFLLKIVLNYNLVGEYNQNGLALSTTFSYFALCASGLFILFYKQNVVSIRTFSVDFIHFLVSAAISYLIIILLKCLVELDSSIIIVFEILSFILTYSINSFILLDNEYIILKNTLKKIRVL